MLKKLLVAGIVMKSGSKSRVRVGFGYHFSGSGRVRVTIFGFLSGNYHWVTLGFSGFSGFHTMNVLNVGFRVGFGYLSPGSGRVWFYRVRVIPPRVSGFRVPDFITSPIPDI